MKEHCIICNSPVLEEYARIYNYYYKKCNKCSSIQLFPMPSEEFLKDCYTKQYYELKDITCDCTTNNNIIYEELYKIRIINTVLNLNNKRLLDYGAGAGNFLNQVNKKFDLDIFAYDKSDFSTDFYINQNINSIPDINNHYEYFDIITMWSVIEHLVDPIDILGKLYSCLKPGGFIFIGTGRVGDLIEKVSFPTSMWLDPPYHTILFTKKSLEFLLTKIGFIKYKYVRFNPLGNLYINPLKLFKFTVKNLTKKMLKIESKSIKSSFGTYQFVYAQKPLK